ncbi:unnamed protein product [Clonostachys chloroleuca]|uniref:MOSC domain-containing protein n=1 Tax=Clonostachys chloroleuca TaxID=1926264 RepID=A0AA35MEY1_9HYPO|nr:unnamed protein product [Clonostachys chloroleuca]
MTHYRQRQPGQSGPSKCGSDPPRCSLDGDQEWDEDFWTRLTLNGRPAFTLTKMCVRCTSVNVDYDTGRPARGERGTVLKKLMADRRVDRDRVYFPTSSLSRVAAHYAM